MVCKFAHKNKIRQKMAPLGGASFYTGLYREIRLNAHSPKPLNLFQLNLAGSIFGEWGFNLWKWWGWHLLGPSKRANRGKIWWI